MGFFNRIFGRDKTKPAISPPAHEAAPAHLLPAGRIAPTPLAANPGVGHEARIALSDHGRPLDINMTAITADAMMKFGFPSQRYGTWLEHPDSGLVILPQLLNLQPIDDRGFQTVTTIQVHHPTLFREGLFEYQHSWGADLHEALRQGVEQWVQTDFDTLLEACLPEPQKCTSLKMTFPAEGNAPERTRRAVLGAVAHFMAKPPAEGAAAEGGSEEHTFCPCCLLTNSFEPFMDLMKGDGFHGIRLFAARDSDGVPQADCRVNGEDFEPGAIALREYVKKWGGTGYEFRKQYVVLQTIQGEHR